MITYPTALSRLSGRQGKTPAVKAALPLLTNGARSRLTVCKRPDCTDMTERVRNRRAKPFISFDADRLSSK
jgi:predicted RNA-binding Zn ribbon-like protein